LDCARRRRYGSGACEQFPDIARESLFAAAICGDVDEDERRLRLDPSGARPTGGSLKWTALTYVAYGRLDAENALRITRLLLDAGADPNVQFDDGWGSPFKVVTGAIRLGEGAKPSHPQAVELVDLLVEAGVNPYDRQALYDVSIVGDDMFWYDRLWRRCQARGKVSDWSDASAGFFDLSMLDYLLGNSVAQNHKPLRSSPCMRWPNSRDRRK
jgi:hypothetical protein